MNALSIAGRSLHAYRRALLVWTLALGALTLLTVLFWPSFQDAAGLEDVLTEMPEAVKELMGATSLTTPEGFLNSQLYTSLFPLLIAVYAAFRASSETAGDEQRGEFELLLGAPLARWQLLLGRFLSVVVAIVVLMAGTAAFTILGVVVVDMPIGIDRIVAAVSALALLGFAFAGITTAVAGMVGRRGVALGAAAGLAVATYVLYGFAPVVPALEGLEVISPFEHAVGYDPLTNGLQVAGSLILAGVGLLGVLIGLATFQRRDVVG